MSIVTTSNFIYNDTPIFLIVLQNTNEISSYMDGNVYKGYFCCKDIF